MDCLKPGDIAIFATPLAFRWVHFTYAIEKGLNVFMEKPLTADGPTSRKMFKLAEEATAKNLKVGVGLMSRHSRAMQELAERIHDGEIGDLVLLRGYRMHGPLGSFRSLPKPAGITDVRYQMQRFHSFLWASGGCFSDFYIHIIDHCGWMKNAWPVKAQALGGRHYRGDYVDQNFDTYSVEYTFADGTKFIMDGRCMTGCKEIYNSFAHGTKGTAIISQQRRLRRAFRHVQGPGVAAGEHDLGIQRHSRTSEDPYQNEWNDLVDAIRNDKPYNEVKRGVEASLVTSMGRMAAHTGQDITYDQMLNCNHEFAPDLDKLTMDGPARCGRRPRQVSRAAAGHRHRPRVCMRVCKEGTPGAVLPAVPRLSGEASPCGAKVIRRLVGEVLASSCRQFARSDWVAASIGASPCPRSAGLAGAAEGPVAICSNCRTPGRRESLCQSEWSFCRSPCNSWPSLRNVWRSLARLLKSRWTLPELLLARRTLGRCPMNPGCSPDDGRTVHHGCRSFARGRRSGIGLLSAAGLLGGHSCQIAEVPAELVSILPEVAAVLRPSVQVAMLVVTILAQFLLILVQFREVLLDLGRIARGKIALQFVRLGCAGSGGPGAGSSGRCATPAGPGAGRGGPV